MGLSCAKCSDGVKELNGCEKDSTMGDRWEVGPYKFARCPLKVITSEGTEYVEAYNFYKANSWPVAGGWTDQANTLIQAIKIMDKELLQIEEKNKQAAKR